MKTKEKKENFGSILEINSRKRNKKIKKKVK